MKPSRVASSSTSAALRYHVRTWGDPRRAQALPAARLDGRLGVVPVPGRRARRRLARAGARLARLRPGGWPQDGYWFADYVADLDALVRALAPARAVDIAGHSLGGNVALMYAGVRPARRRAASSRSTASAFRARRPSARPRSCAVARCARGSAGVRALPRASRPWPIACRRTTAGCRATRRSSWRSIGREALPDGTRAPARRPAHKLPFPDVYRLEDIFAIWHRSRRRRCGSRRDDSAHPALARRRRRCRRREIARRCAHVPGATLVTIADAGHMLHHDQPEAVARALESFLALMRAAPCRAFAARRLRGAGVPHADLGQQLGRDEARAAVGQSGRAQRAAHVARDARAVRGAALAARGRCCPTSWLAVIVTGFFQTTINFGSTTMALAGGGAGRTSVLVFTMPFWTLLLAWPVLHERVKGYQWLAVGLRAGRA